MSSGHIQDMTLLDAYACGNPFVVGIDHLGEHLIVEDVVREVRGYAGNSGVKHDL